MVFKLLCIPHAEARGLLRSARVVCPSSELSITSSIHGTTSNSIARLLGNRPTPSIDASQARQLALRHNQGSDRGFQARLPKRGLIVLRPSTSPSEFFSWPFAALSALPPRLAAILFQGMHLRSSFSSCSSRFCLSKWLY